MRAPTPRLGLMGFKLPISTFWAVLSARSFAAEGTGERWELKAVNSNNSNGVNLSVTSAADSWTRTVSFTPRQRTLASVEPPRSEAIRTDTSSSPSLWAPAHARGFQLHLAGPHFTSTVPSGPPDLWTSSSNSRCRDNSLGTILSQISPPHCV